MRIIPLIFISLVLLSSCGSQESSGIPDTPEQRSKEAQIQAHLESLQETSSKVTADQALKKLEEENPKSILLQVRKAQKYMELALHSRDSTELDNAYKLVQKLEKHTNSHPELYYLEALYIQETDEFSDTEPLLRKLLEINPYHLDGHINLIDTLIKKVNIVAAEEEIQITRSLLERSILSESEKSNYNSKIKEFISLVNK